VPSKRNRIDYKFPMMDPPILFTVVFIANINKMTCSTACAFVEHK